MSAGDVTLTDAEKTYGRKGLNIGDRGRWYSEASVERILAERLAAREADHRAASDEVHRLNGILAARTPTATGDDLRDRVWRIVEQWETAAEEADRGAYTITLGPRHCVAALRNALADSFVPAPVVSRPEAVVKAEALREAADAVEALRTFAHGNNPTSKAHVIGFGTARRVAARLLRDRAASLDSAAP